MDHPGSRNCRDLTFRASDNSNALNQLTLEGELIYSVHLDMTHKCIQIYIYKDKYKYIYFGDIQIHIQMEIQAD